MAVEVRTTEERIAHIEGILGQMNERVRSIEERIGKVEEEIRHLREEMTSQFRWMIGMWISAIIVIIATIIAKG